MPRVNRARKASEFVRAYGSRARVRFVKALPCCYCVALSPLFGRTDGSSHNAHTEGDGGSHKASYTKIVPLCASHHRRFDEHQFPFDTEVVRALVRACCADVQAKWRAHVGAAAA
jgi:hypothetical protein